MTLASQKEAAKKFVQYWKGKGYEKGQSQPFWLSLLREVYGIAEPEKFITFEDQVHLDNTSFIDGYIESTHVMIEQKSLGKDLQKHIRQSDGRLLTPFEQAKRYSQELPYSKRPRWIVTCNFESFLIYDMEHPGVEPQMILLKDLPEESWRMEFLVDYAKTQILKEQEISLNAGIIVRQLYDALAECYGDMSDNRNHRSLNKLIVRLVFCLYAEDAEMFGHGQFQNYLKHFDAEDLSDALYRLFEVLDTREEDRRRGLKPILAAFPYTNGGLFHDKEDADDTEIPPLTEEVKRILEDVATPFSWQKISPTIFGGIFESTLNPETRRSGGMHYTSIENIHKVIDPLFLDNLMDEFHAIRDEQPKTKDRVKYAAWRQKLSDFQDKLASLKFLDPACGSGNFLTETYLSLRRLENEVIRILFGEGMLGLENDLIKVSIQQFYGIEINDFAVAVATTALWISEAQTLRETEDIIMQVLPALPLKSYTNIHEGNALRIDWNEVIPAEGLSFIMGNPPFLGARIMSAEQKDDLISVFGTKWKNIGNMDYVTGWYKKSLEMMQSNSLIHAALVSTNSITQGEQVANLWKPIMESGVHIDFAWRTFIWDSEASQKAHVHCVIVGFSTCHSKYKRRIFDGEEVIEASNINGYLLDADSVFINNRNTPICNVPEISMGNQPIDNGNYLFKDDEKDEFLRREPGSEKFFKRWYGADEFINRRPRWCLWLGEANPMELIKLPECMKLIENVRKYRLSSSRSSTIKLADRPTRFQTENMPKGHYIVIPEVSSEKRVYVPMGYMDDCVLCSNKLRLMPDSSLYHFGILNSSVHMDWMRAVCGRLEMRYDYSIKIVYNNFPWPQPTEVQKQRIKETAQGILNAREKYPDASLADLYGNLILFPELRKAHRDNDTAVLEAYGFPKDAIESDIVARLFMMYQELTT